MTATIAMTAIDRDDRDSGERTHGHVTSRLRETGTVRAHLLHGQVCVQPWPGRPLAECRRPPHPGYSARNVIAGSTCAARHAGAQHAITATPPSSAITPR